ncbi:MAG TPA: NUDIX domain-containing protein [Chitinophagaceae bacterium]|nr:NUDIX domain-containing protein [Chitinophagaceae bacterium]MCB9054811.1 NUDIX domain-containing protein [Chitinophagales bacterium]HPG10958.1 NUDIX domain-containing protein [Chitinophagaceae bacterium]HRX93676.1 NUDIX domain-containing protein [Chitinophagaceae bacterium]
MAEKDLLLKTAETEKISHIDYFNIAISVDCVIFGYEDKELKVLLIKSDLKEFEGMYSLLGDLIRPGEDLDAASYRVLKERTGLDDVYLEQVHAFGSINRHPSGRVITIAYYSLIDIGHHKLQLSHNELNWHSINELGKLAFDHSLILETCLKQLRERIEDHPIVFNLLPEKFSLRQLQELYEAILGVELDRRNFRKKISLKGWLKDLNEMEKNLSHRPGKLYTLKSKLKT